MKLNFLIALLLLTFSGFCQHPNAVNIEEENNTLPLQKIFLTTDKVIYTPNEQLWFSAYILEKSIQLKDTADVLTVALYDQLTERFVFVKKVLINSRLATGNILLPDSLKTGSYTLIAYTNLIDTNKTASATCFKPIKIYSKSGDKSFATSLSIIDSLSNEQKLAIQLTMISARQQLTFEDVQSKYRFYDTKPHKLNVDLFGNGIIYIDRTDISTKNNILYTQTIYQEDTVEDRIKIYPTTNKNEFSVAFHPEGGQLTAGFTNRVFWEANKNQTAYSVNAMLLENGHTIDTISTNANGWGNFSFTPISRKKYTILINDKGVKKEYPLPEITDTGLKLLLPKVVVNDTLPIEIQSKEPQKIKLLITDVNESPVIIPVTITSNKKLAILLQDYPKGICKLYVLDTLNKVLAGSYFFAKHNSGNKVILQTDKNIYNTRDSVQLFLDVRNYENKKINAVTTISCVLMSRIDLFSLKDISYDQFFNNLAYNESARLKTDRILDNSAILENILRLKTPDNNILPYFQRMQDTHTIHFTKPQTLLKVYKYDKPLKKSTELIFIKDGNFSAGKTNEEGSLVLYTDDLIVKDGRKLFAKGMGKKNSEVYAKVYDSLLIIKDNIQVPEYLPTKRVATQDIQALFLTDKNEKFARTLETVVVKSNKNYGALGRPNPCGDYVCQYNILNCPNHLVPYKWPVKGQTYSMPFGGGRTVYMGCDYMDNIYINSNSLIYLPRTFLGMDSTLLKQEYPEYLSTVCWKPFFRIDKQEPQSLTFNTSDQTGVYLITVQGFGENGEPVYSEKTIRVE